MKKIVIISFTLLTFFSCEEETSLTFSEINSIYNESTTIEINIPKAEGNNDISNAINSTLENNIIKTLNFSENNSNDLKLDDAIKVFETDYIEFKNDFQESNLVWEASFDGEITFQSTEVVCIAFSSFSFTGGAHGNTNITLYNFNPQTGNILKFDEIFNDKKGFTELVKRFFKKETGLENENDYEDAFFGNDFSLPENIGFNNNGIIILYNVYEIASYAQGVTEFTIPYKDVNEFLKIN